MGQSETLTIKLPPGESDRPNPTPTVPVPTPPGKEPERSTLTAAERVERVADLVGSGE
jgi:hypothetical protein